MSAITFPGQGYSSTAFGGRAVPRLRITRRGRGVLLTLAAIPVALLMAVFGLNAATATATSDLSSNTFDYVEVAPGQSLWSLAEQIAPEANPAEVVADMMSLNQLTSADIQPGQSLAIPAEYTAD
ncbi:MAG TPA: LysM peptidoglycan-binding domain-containing protein [Pseudolysinimonas sp.]|nr:LysM peptidoglycan-binding domain-containing protein [Pseudolysinimonas sp.]